jgi:hypothetical protein
LDDRNQWTLPGVEVASATIHPHQPVVAVADPDNVVRVFHIPTGQQIGADMEQHADRVVTMTFSPDGALLAAQPRMAP